MGKSPPVRNFTAFGVKEIIEEIRKWKEEMNEKVLPRVLVCTELLSTKDKCRIHKTGDAFVSTHRGEGWGLPQAEASVYGNTVISTGYGGIHEYFAKRQYLEIEYDMVPISKVYNKYYEPGMLWAEAREESVRKNMQRGYRNFKDSKFGRINAQTLVNGIFNYEVVGKQMLNRLSAITNSQ